MAIHVASHVASRVASIHLLSAWSKRGSDRVGIVLGPRSIHNLYGTRLGRTCETLDSVN